MTTYVVVLGVVFLCNVLPAFAPPTWAVLVFFSLNYELNAIALIAIGLTGATTGRWALANLFRRYRGILPKRYLVNMQNASTHLNRSTAHISALLALFFISPLSSAQLFEAAGIMTTVRIRPLLIAFAAGRVVSYTTYVFSAQAVQESSFGALLGHYLTTPQGIAVQILTVVGLVLLGNVPWRPHTPTVSTTTNT
jgi:hypothetical protein